MVNRSWQENSGLNRASPYQSKTERYRQNALCCLGAV
ncbi:Uncharacterised protein [Vibrio cholerae]|nr:Uncharacterised protein [Vibrio cholerae]